MTYTSLEQRIAGNYPAMLPPFHPREDAPVTPAQQEEFYLLTQRLYQLLFDNPSLLFPTLHPDDAFPTRYKGAYGKPKLSADVQKIKKTIEALLKAMFLLGRGEEVKFTKRQQAILSSLGVEAGSLPPAWVWMATRPGADPVAFAYCLFDQTHTYAADAYARLLGEGPFRRLEQWMLSRGYRPFDIYRLDRWLLGRGEWPDYRLTLTYANPAWSPERPSIGNEYKINHTGISVQYDAYVQNPVSLGLCIPHGLAPFLTHFDAMEDSLKDFVIERTKHCDGCRYCVQTDKKGVRPLARIPVRYQGEEHLLCPIFPGYAYSWTDLDDALVDNLISFLSFMDSVRS